MQTSPIVHGARTAGSRRFVFLRRRTIVDDVVQGIIIGAVLAFVTFRILAHAYLSKVNGWTTMCGCGERGNRILLRDACANEFPGPINVPQEAIYWKTNKDGAGQKLSGAHDYILHFPSGGLPSSKRTDIAYEAQTSHYVRLGHDCGVGDRHVPLGLFLAAPGE